MYWKLTVDCHQSNLSYKGEKMLNVARTSVGTSAALVATPVINRELLHLDGTHMDRTGNECVLGN